jgi:hypothetical protein
MPGNASAGPSRSAGERFGPSDSSWSEEVSSPGREKLAPGGGAISISDLRRCEPLAGCPASG